MSETLTPTASLNLSLPKVGINPWFIAITVTLATFMELLDTAIANVAPILSTPARTNFHIAAVHVTPSPASVISSSVATSLQP